ncbi:MAG: hypothetical protein LW875_08140 [Proteobacteria bacterium]|nr:hypothetical protein [Pseudomonadota bacterium]
MKVKTLFKVLAPVIFLIYSEAGYGQPQTTPTQNPFAQPRNLNDEMALRSFDQCSSMESSVLSAFERYSSACSKAGINSTADCRSRAAECSDADSEEIPSGAFPMGGVSGFASRCSNMTKSDFTSRKSELEKKVEQAGKDIDDAQNKFLDAQEKVQENISKINEEIVDVDKQLSEVRAKRGQEQLEAAAAREEAEQKVQQNIVSITEQINKGQADLIKIEAKRASSLAAKSAELLRFTCKQEVEKALMTKDEKTGAIGYQYQMRNRSGGNLIKRGAQMKEAATEIFENCKNRIMKQRDAEIRITELELKAAQKNLENLENQLEMQKQNLQKALERAQKAEQIAAQQQQEAEQRALQTKQQLIQKMSSSIQTFQQRQQTSQQSIQRLNFNNNRLSNELAMISQQDPGGATGTLGEASGAYAAYATQLNRLCSSDCTKRPGACSKSGDARFNSFESGAR